MAETEALKIPILGQSIATEQQLKDYLKQRNPNAPDYAQLYLDFGSLYGVRGDIAFAQSMLETNFWRFGGSVRPEQNNFSGLGATSQTEGGASFSTPSQGIEAQIQHLYGYATEAPIPAGRIVVDPRFQILETANLRGTAPNWEDLNGKWAVPGTTYGQDIVRLWSHTLTIPVNPDQWKIDALAWLSSSGLVNSPHDPDASITWAELGTVLRRMATTRS
jgi:hypothetical protein